MRSFAYAIRALSRQRALALTAMLTLALGVGATTTIFSVVNAVLLRPLPYPAAEQLVFVWGELRNRNVAQWAFSPGDYRDLRADATLFADMAAVAADRQPLVGDGSEPEQVTITGMTPNALALLGGRVVLGRGFDERDAQLQAVQTARSAPPPAVVVEPLPSIVLLGHEFWQRRYGGDQSVIGRVIDVGGNRAEIVGVLDPGFEVLFPTGTEIEPVTDLYVAMRIDYENASRNDVFLRPFGRLRADASLERAQEQVDRVAAALRERYPIKQTAGMHFSVEPMRQGLVADVRPALVSIMGAVACVLLIACANVANLLVVRAADRERDHAVRIALGGTSGRLAQLVLAESLVLAAGGALLGVMLAHGGVGLLVALAPPDIPRLPSIRVDATVMLFAIAISVVAAAVFGLLPSLRAARPNVAQLLRSAGRTPGLLCGRAVHGTVVAIEVALSFMLLVGSGLMLRSFVALQRANPGFDPNGVMTFQVASTSREPEARAAFKRQLGERLAAIPGVTAVTAASPLPLDGNLASARWGTADAAGDPAKFQQASVRVVLPGYFTAMRTPVIAGRVFEPSDNRDSAAVVVIDTRLAAKAFPGQSAIGQRLLIRVRTAEPEWVEVIGVVAHQRHETLAADGRETFYVTDGFTAHSAANRWAVRVSGDASAILPSIRRAVTALDPTVPIADAQTMEEMVARAQGPTRFALVLIATFAGVAAALAGVGLYGVMATMVRQRTVEIGVRAALGAPRARIFRLVVGEGLRLAAIGIAIGIAAAIAGTGVLASLLIGVTGTDPATYLVMGIVFLGLTLLACWIPAWRAASLEPVRALRNE